MQQIKLVCKIVQQLDILLTKLTLHVMLAIKLV